MSYSKFFDTSKYLVKDSTTLTLLIKNFHSNHRCASARFSLTNGNNLRHNFCAKLHPRGIKNFAPNEIMLSMQLLVPGWSDEPLGGSLLVHCVVSVLDANGAKWHSVENLWNFNRYTETNFTKLINRADLNNLLTVTRLDECKLSVLVEVYVLELNHQSESHFLPYCLNDLLESGRCSDVTFVLDGGVRVAAHKSILVARSRVFAAMFEHFDGVEKQQNVVTFPNVREDVFREFLLYIYTGKVKCLNECAFDLLELAEKYQTKGLKDMCQNELCSWVNEDTVCRLLHHADMHCAEQLRNRCRDFLIKHRNKVIHTEQWNQMIALQPELGKISYEMIPWNDEDS